MNDNIELRANAMLAEVRQQRDFAYNRCSVLAGDLAIALSEIEALRARISDLGKKSEAQPELNAVQ